MKINFKVKISIILFFMLISARLQATAINLYGNDYLFQVYFAGQETIDWPDTSLPHVIQSRFDLDGEGIFLSLIESEEWLYSNTLETLMSDFPLLLTFGVVFIGRRSLIDQ